jgi:NADPH:quinone reductase-like Zn-dependent oxidoreductase
MKAVVQETYGPADAAWLQDIGRSEAGEREVLVRVHAAPHVTPVAHLAIGRHRQGRPGTCSTNVTFTHGNGGGGQAGTGQV